MNITLSRKTRVAKILFMQSWSIAFCNTAYDLGSSHWDVSSL